MFSGEQLDHDLVCKLDLSFLCHNPYFFEIFSIKNQWPSTKNKTEVDKGGGRGFKSDEGDHDMVVLQDCLQD